MQTTQHTYTIGVGKKAQTLTQPEFFAAQLAIAKKNGGECRLPLSILLGFAGNGKPFDPNAYNPHNLPHPRPASYYSAENDRFATVLHGIKASQAIDDALTVYPLPEANQFAILDGLTRASCAAILRAENDLLFRKVNCRLFVGTLAQAKLEMIARNWTGRKQSLSNWEQIESVRRMRFDWQLEFAEIAKALGRPESYKSVLSQMANFSVDATEQTKQALQDGSLSLHAALNLSKAEPETQNTATQQAAETGSAITVNDAKKAAKQSNTNTQNGKTRGRKASPTKALERISDAIETVFGFIDDNHPQNTQANCISEPYRAEFDDFYERITAEIQSASTIKPS